MKRFLLPLMVILTVVSATGAGCSRSQTRLTSLLDDKPRWSEKQTIDYLYKYLSDKFERIGCANSATRLIVDWQFTQATLDANRQAVQTMEEHGLGESVYMRFGQSSMDTLAWTSALKYLAKYNGDTWWSVTVGDREWRVNEANEEVVAWNEAAKQLMQEITPKTYHNSFYGYYVDYPPSWTVDESDKGKVMLRDGLPDTMAFVYIVAVDKGTLASFGGLRGYINARLVSFSNEYYTFVKTSVSYLTIEYEFRKAEDSPLNQGRHHTITHGDRLFEIICCGRVIDLTGVVGRPYSYSSMYDPFESFRSQP